MQKLAIFGGTFNPVHWGHLLLAETARTQVALDRVIWVPTYAPPYKSSANLLEFRHRSEMVQRAIQSHPQFTLSNIEQEHSSPSYALDTLLHLQTLHPDSRWYWIVGLDAFRALPYWHRHEELVAQCDWLVAPRLERRDQGLENQDQEKFNPQAPTFNTSSLFLCKQVAETLAARSISLKWHLLDMPLIEVSSSLIREYCHAQRSIRYLVPEPVRAYILRHNLYQQQK